MLKSYFELQSSFKVSYAPASVKKWRSTRTGLQVTLVDQASPIVNGYFAVATEILNDSGCPHTLEHLVFMGSKKYPYKGLLDILGNLAFSNTNAWTATDQTVYTLTTAGWEGFKMLLPIYLDHIFSPTLTDAACYTEVYHIDGTGKDKGVVYSEMQGIENQSWFIQNLETQRSMFKNSGYKSETGGLTTNLRSLDADTIRQYHKDNYRPDNLCVIITGSVNEKELLDSMIKFDATLNSLAATPSLRPFVDTPKDLPLTETVVKTVEFPDEDESSGEISFSWIGPDGTDIILDQAIDTLGKYLTSSSVSLLNQNFVEVEHPVATSTEFYTDSYVNVCLNMSLSNVPTNELEELPQKVLDLLKEHCSKDKLDLKRLRDITEQTMWKFIYQTEQSPENIANLSIFEFEYGNVNGKDLEKWGSTLNEYETILKWDIDQWLEVFQKYFVDNHSCIVLAKPSKALYKKSKKDNKDFLKARKEKLGHDGLKRLEDELKKAQEQNNIQIPAEILNSFGQPDPSAIAFIKTESVAVGLNKEIENQKGSEAVKKIAKDTPENFPLYLHIENTESNFVNVELLFSSFEVNQNLLPMLNIFQTLTTLPIENDDGTLMSYEDVVKSLKQDTISYSFSNTFGGTYEELLNFRLIVKSSEYQKAIEWFIKLMFKTKFTKERVLVGLKKLTKSLPELKRSGVAVLRSLIHRTVYTKRSYLHSCDPLDNEQYYKDLIQQIENGDDAVFKGVEEKLEEIRAQLFKLSNIKVFIVGDMSKIEKPISLWNSLISETKNKGGELVELPKQSLTLSGRRHSTYENCFMITTPGSDSSYLELITSIPKNEYITVDAVKIALGISYLQCVEGPFWRGIRGAGLAYGANCYRNGEVGELKFSIYRGADVEKCFQVGKKLVEGFANGVEKIDHKMMQGALSAIVSGLAESQSNAFSSAAAKFINDVLYKRGPNYNEHFMKELRSITTEDLKEIFQKYFVNIFNPKTSVCFVSCSPSKSEGIENFFKNAGYAVSVEKVESSNAEGSDEEASDNSDNDSDDDSDNESGEDSNDDSESEEENDSQEDSDGE